MSIAALWTNHRPLAHRIARDYYLPTGEPQDVTQEAMIGLWIAARTWDREKGRFPAFAELVIRRRLVTVLRTALAGHSAILTEAARVGRNEEGAEVVLVDEQPGGRDPLEVVLEREKLERILAAVADLTVRQRESLARVVNGERVSKPEHNAAWVARRKLKAVA